MNRRGFLGGLAAMVTGSTLHAQHTATASDVFLYRGYEVRWTGWRESPQQLIKFGIWAAMKDGRAPIFYATTMGSQGTLRSEFEVLDLTHQHRDGRQAPTVYADADLMDRNKREALAMLIARIDRGGSL